MRETFTHFQNPILPLPITIVVILKKKKKTIVAMYSIRNSQSRVHIPKSPYSASSQLYLKSNSNWKNHLLKLRVKRLKTTPSS